MNMHLWFLIIYLTSLNFQLRFPFTLFIHKFFKCLLYKVSGPRRNRCKMACMVPKTVIYIKALITSRTIEIFMVRSLRTISVSVDV